MLSFAVFPLSMERVANAVRRSTPLRRFARDERGVAAVEFAMILPLLLGLLTGGIVMWDVFRYAQTAERATYTIADLASRESVVGADVMERLHRTHGALLGGKTNRYFTRITSVEVREVTNRRGKKRIVREVAWSWNSITKTVSKPRINLRGMPLVGPGDSVLLVETHTARPDFLNSFRNRPRYFLNYTWVRPRYVSLKWN